MSETATDQTEAGGTCHGCGASDMALIRGYCAGCAQETAWLTPSHDYTKCNNTRCMACLRIVTLMHALRDAIEEVESWAAYAGDYFQEKHDLAGALERLREVLDAR